MIGRSISPDLQNGASLVFADTLSFYCSLCCAPSIFLADAAVVLPLTSIPAFMRITWFVNIGTRQKSVGYWPIRSSMKRGGTRPRSTTTHSMCRVIGSWSHLTPGLSAEAADPTRQDLARSTAICEDYG